MHGQLELTPTYTAQLDGKVMANAFAVGDVDGDGASELVFGSLTGKVTIFKVRKIHDSVKCINALDDCGYFRLRKIT